MEPLPEPTVWEWVGFAITMLALALITLRVIADRLPGPARAFVREQVPALLVEGLRLLSWAFAWLGAGFIWLLSAGRVPVVDDLLGRAARGRPVNPLPEAPLAYGTLPASPPPTDGNVSAGCATAETPVDVIAVTSTGGNEPLPGNRIVRVQAAVVARLLRSKMLYIADGRGGFKPVGETELIRLATGIGPSGRADSEYQQLKAVLNPLIQKKTPAAAGAPEERAVAAE